MAFAIDVLPVPGGPYKIKEKITLFLIRFDKTLFSPIK